MSVTVEGVRDVLKNVYDPEIPINVVDLGLIYAIEVDEGQRQGRHDPYLPRLWHGPHDRPAG